MPRAPTPPASTDALTADDVVEAVHAVMHAFRARQQRAQRDGEHDLAHMEAKTLGYFARHPGATQRDLVQHAGRDKGQIARLIAGLRERHLLDASPDDQDRRSVRLQVSAEGHRLLAVWQAHAQQVAGDAAAGMTVDERRTLVALLARMQDNLAGE